jgi:hypothetical protein
VYFIRDNSGDQFRSDKKRCAIQIGRGSGQKPVIRAISFTTSRAPIKEMTGPRATAFARKGRRTESKSCDLPDAVWPHPWGLPLGAKGYSLGARMDNGRL